MTPKNTENQIHRTTTSDTRRPLQLFTAKPGQPLVNPTHAPLDLFGGVFIPQAYKHHSRPLVVFSTLAGSEPARVPSTPLRGTHGARKATQEEIQQAASVKVWAHAQRKQEVK